MHARTFLRADKLRLLVDVSGFMAGVDEVGRGPLAGPVVAAAVILEEKKTIRGLNDSKLLSAEQRNTAYAALRASTAWVGVGAASVTEIGRLNILRASLLAMRRAVLRLPCVPDLALVDGNQAPALPCPVQCCVGGDGRSLSIAAASVVAKVLRDRAMARLAVRYPAFGWERNAGYGTAAHRAALRDVGPCRHHRAGFGTVRQLALAVPAG